MSIYLETCFEDRFRKFKLDLGKLKAGGVKEDVLYEFMYKAFEDDVELFCQVVLAHWFTSRFGKPHHELFDMYADNLIKYGVIAFPRKHGKTTCMKGFVLWCAVYHKHDYMLLVGDTEDKASLHLQSIRLELENNELLRAIYGSLRSGAPKWNDKEIRLKNKFHIRVMSKGQSARGLLDDVPPDYCLIDDFDDDETIENIDIRNKYDDWMFTSLLQALNPQIGKCRMTGTCIHDDGQLMRVIKNKTWVHKLYSCIDEDGNPLWPEYYTRDMLLTMKKNLFQADPPKIQTWWKEWMNKPLNQDNQTWDAAHLQHWQGRYKDGAIYFTADDGEVLRKVRVACFTAIDIASAEGTSKKKDSVVVTTGALDQNGNVYLLKVWRKRNFKPSEVVYQIFAQHETFNTRMAIIELISCQDLIMETYDTIARGKRSRPVLKKLRKRTGSKQDKIKGNLSDRLRLKQIFIKRNMTEVHDEFAGFPDGHDDILDTISDIVEHGFKPAKEAIKRISQLPIELQSDKTKGDSRSFVQRVVGF